MLLDKVGRVMEYYESALLQVEGLCNKVINYYRERNKVYRSSPNTDFPTYFYQPVSLNLPTFALDLDLDNERKNQAELANKFNEYREEDSARIKSELDDIHNKEIENLDTYFGNA